MSPLERQDPNLKNLEVDASGAPPPTGATAAGDPTVDDADVTEEVDEEELTEEEAAEELEEEYAEEQEYAREKEERKHEPSSERHHTPGPFSRLYRGQTSFDFVGRRRWWFGASGIIIVAGIISLVLSGLNLGIDFKGGTSWTVSAPGVKKNEVQPFHRALPPGISRFCGLFTMFSLSR